MLDTQACRRLTLAILNQWAEAVRDKQEGEYYLWELTWDCARWCSLAGVDHDAYVERIRDIRAGKVRKPKLTIQSILDVTEPGEVFTADTIFGRLRYLDRTRHARTRLLANLADYSGRHGNYFERVCRGTYRRKA